MNRKHLGGAIGVAALGSLFVLAAWGPLDPPDGPITSTYKTLIANLLSAAQKGDKQQAEALLRETLSKIDKASKRRVLHPNTAARRKSLVMRAVRDLAKKA